MKSLDIDLSLGKPIKVPSTQYQATNFTSKERGLFSRVNT